MPGRAEDRWLQVHAADQRRWLKLAGVRAAHGRFAKQAMTMCVLPIASYCPACIRYVASLPPRPCERFGLVIHLGLGRSA